MASTEHQPQADWTDPEPQYIPPPSFHPAGLALGVVLFVWPPAFFYVKWWVVTPVAAVIIICVLYGWIREIRGDWRADDGE